MKRIIKLIVFCFPALCFLLTSCDNKEDKVNSLISEYLKNHGVPVQKLEVKNSSMSEAKQIAVNDSALWSLVPNWIECVRQVDSVSKQEYGDYSLQVNLLLQVGLIMANEYVDSINYRIKQLDPTKTLGFEFIQDVSVTLDNNEKQDLRFKVITDSDVSKILLLVPLISESERTIKIIEEAQNGKLTKFPVDYQTETMYYLSTGKTKPSF